MTPSKVLHAQEALRFCELSLLFTKVRIIYKFIYLYIKPNLLTSHNFLCHHSIKKKIKPKPKN